ncbi:MAG: PDZ domain-containing protein, partial [Acidobacteria bacterium]
KRGYLGISTQPVNVTLPQTGAGAGEEALLVVNVKDGTPASQAGLLVGDLLLSLDGHPLTTTDDLFDLLCGDRVQLRASSGRPTAPTRCASECVAGSLRSDSASAQISVGTSRSNDMATIDKFSAATPAHRR